MTAVVEKTETTPTVRDATQTDPPARWHRRACALGIDVVPAVAVVTTLALSALTVPSRGQWWWICAVAAGLVILLTLVNRLVLPSTVGWSLGRAVVGIAVVRPDGAPVGPWRLVLRDLAHLLDTASALVGWLWPLWDDRRRTFADLLVRTEVRTVAQRAPLQWVRRLTVIAVLGAAALCLAGTAISWLVVSRPQWAVARASKQVSEQGPKMVVEMLSYDPKTLHDDFAHAQSLTTDNYRPQLVQQQQAVQQHPVFNEYFVTNTAVLQPAASDRVSMLVFLRGERGLPPEQRFITATVRVKFARGADARWRVDDLTVLTKPAPAASGK